MFHSFFASIPYQWYTSRNENIGNYEGYYASVFYGFLSGLGSRVHCEDSTNQGRMDLWFDFDDTIYIVEFKMANSELEVQNQQVQAIEQIKTKNYADKFQARQTPIVLMGIVFGKEERNIISFRTEILKEDAITITAQWDKKQLLKEYQFTDGQIMVRGNKVRRGTQKKADYILTTTNRQTPLAVIEAKRLDKSVGHGMQQAMEYAQILDIPFAYSSNGKGFLEHDFFTGGGNCKLKST